jgi:hypothetical protein
MRLESLLTTYWRMRALACLEQRLCGRFAIIMVFFTPKLGAHNCEPACGDLSTEEEYEPSTDDKPIHLLTPAILSSYLRAPITYYYLRKLFA